MSSIGFNPPQQIQLSYSPQNNDGLLPRLNWSHLAEQINQQSAAIFAKLIQFVPIQPLAHLVLDYLNLPSDKPFISAEFQVQKPPSSARNTLFALSIQGRYVFMECFQERTEYYGKNNPKRRDGYHTLIFHDSICPEQPFLSIREEFTSPVNHANFNQTQYMSFAMNHSQVEPLNRARVVLDCRRKYTVSGAFSPDASLEMYQLNSESETWDAAKPSSSKRVF